MPRGSQRSAREHSRKLPPHSNPDRSRRTRRALLAAGRAVFTEQGYTHTTIPEIFHRAGVTRGAFSHHFPSKAAFFAVVFEEACGESIHAVRTCMQTAAGDTWTQFVASLGVWLEQMGRPSVQRIVYLDGPAVLEGSHVYRQPPDKQFLRSVFTQLRAEGLIDPLLLDPCVHLVWAMCSGAASYIAQAEERAVAQRDMRAVLVQLMAGLRSPQQAEDREGQGRSVPCS